MICEKCNKREAKAKVLVEIEENRCLLCANGKVFVGVVKE